MRRAFDLLCAATGLIVLSPVFILITLAIKMGDRGPVFYSQPRVGKGFREFRLLKFRTMVPRAERNGLLTALGDSRITRVGRFLRKYKLDELPQLINVLKGDMQLVGSRPEVRRYVELFPSQYAVLLRERPGITDPATVAYRHEEQSFEAGRMEEQYVSQILPRKLELSLDHLRQRNFRCDLSILFETLVGSRSGRHRAQGIQAGDQSRSHDSTQQAIVPPSKQGGS